MHQPYTPNRTAILTPTTNSSPNRDVFPVRVLLRFSGEVSTKAPATRRQFLTRMRRNIKEALKSEHIAFRFQRHRGRLVIDLDSDAGIDIVSRIFGIQSLSRVVTRPVDALPSILEQGCALFEEQVRGKRFAVRARRIGPRAKGPFTSRDIETALGAALLPMAAGVDLDQPEVTVGIELFKGEAHFFTERITGHGGLPLGTEGKALCLLSGGFDSPVAAWQMLRRGVMLDYVFFNMGGTEHQRDVLDVAKILADRWSYGSRPKLHAVDFTPLLQLLREHTERRYWQVLLKRLMVRMATRIASEVRAIALVKGDAVGQVSSQTLQNIAVISRATDLTILRPVVGMNKEEIVELSKVVGTHDAAARIREHCAMVAKGPATAARLGDIQREEEYLEAAGASERIERLLAQRSIFDLRSLRLVSSEGITTALQKIPDNALIIDLRSKAAYQGWHFPNALHLEFSHALELHPPFDPEKTYVFYCEYEIKSAQLAELLTRRGVRGYHFRGGLKALVHYAMAQGLTLPEFLAPVTPSD